MTTAAEIVGAAWASGWRPDPLLNVSEWADANVILSTTDSSEPGPFRTSRTPYVREIVFRLTGKTKNESHKPRDCERRTKPS